jgi:hypothetical protein
LSYLVSGDIARIVAGGMTPITTDNIDVVARKVLKVFEAYFRHRKRLYRSRLTQVGLELALVKRFLQGLTISETIKWLKAHKGFRISKSAVGRYWEVLCRVGISPTGYVTTD